MRHRLKMLRMIIIINSVYRCLFMLLQLEWNMPFANLGSKSTSTSASQKVACKHLGAGLCSFIHSGYFYNASSSPLLLRGAPDYSIDTASELTRQSTTGNCERRTCPARVRFKPATLRTEDTKLTIKPTHQMYR